MQKYCMLAGWILFLGSGAAVAQIEVVQTWDAPKIYRQMCAPCHGVDGSGLPPQDPRVTTFSTLPADLTDPLFNSREPRLDWAMVIKHGGAPMGLSSQMPAFGQVLSDEKIAELVDFLKGLADTRGYPPGDLNYPRALETIKAFPEDEFLIIGKQQVDKTGEGSFVATLYYARRLGRRYQLEVKFDSQIADRRWEPEELELGFKGALFYRLRPQILVTLGLESSIPLQHEGESVVLMPYLSLAKGLGHRFTLQATVRHHLPVARGFRAGDIALSAIVHWITTPWPRGVFPALEVDWTKPLDGRPGFVSLIPQFYIGLSRRGHVAAVVGAEWPLNDAAYRYRIRGFLLWEFPEGPLWEGW